jgi:hypothetical protein
MFLLFVLCLSFIFSRQLPNIHYLKLASLNEISPPHFQPNPLLQQQTEETDGDLNCLPCDINWKLIFP